MKTELKDKLDLDAFFETVSSPFAGAVQYNRNIKDSVYNIKYICSFVEGDNLTPDEAMSKLAKLVVGDKKDDQLLDWSYKSNIKAYQNTEWKEEKGIFNAGEWCLSSDEPSLWSILFQHSFRFSASDRQWLYQTCTEFGYYQTFSGGDTPFPAGYNDVQYSYQTCKDVFGNQ